MHTLYRWELRKEESSTIFKVFGMTQPGIEPRSSRLLVNTLPTRPMSRFVSNKSPVDIKDYPESDSTSFFLKK